MIGSKVIPLQNVTTGKNRPARGDYHIIETCSAYYRKKTSAYAHDVIDVTREYSPE